MLTEKEKQEIETMKQQRVQSGRSRLQQVSPYRQREKEALSNEVDGETGRKDTR